jgi:hypothetical protein
MLGMTGQELIRELSAERPGLQVVLMSGCHRAMLLSTSPTRAPTAPVTERVGGLRDRSRHYVLDEYCLDDEMRSRVRG